MSLLLCRLEPVKHPFVVAELGVRLFSSQELCYVIYENPLLVMEDFVDERLIQFIREDLDMDFLAGKLENWKKSGEDPDNMLLLILAECSYYTSGEVNRYRQTLIQLRKNIRLSLEKSGRTICSASVSTAEELRCTKNSWNFPRTMLSMICFSAVSGAAWEPAMRGCFRLKKLIGPMKRHIFTITATKRFWNRFTI